jgi:hypothetical protein
MRADSPARSWYRTPWATAGAALLALLLIVFVVGQLVLPGIATERVQDRVERYGAVRAVHVHAVPAVQLLWGDAQEISVKAGQLRISPSQLVELEQSLDGVGSAELTSPQMSIMLSSVASGEVLLEHVRLSKRGNALTITGVLRAPGMRVALPAGFEVDGLSADSGQPEASVSGGAFGVHVSGRGVMRAKEGGLVVEPVALPFGGFAAVKLFSDPRVVIETLRASPQGEGLLITMRARTAS